MNALAREHAVEIWMAGLDSVRAEPLVRREVRVDGKRLIIGESSWSRDEIDRVIVVGAGKAGSAMAKGLAASIGNWRPIVGWVNVPEGTQFEFGSIRLHPARPAGLNEPTEAGVLGSDQILRLVQNATARDLCIALISGGGSALLPAPIDGIILADKLAVIRCLSGAGADITQLNTVRKHLSRVKGGRLADACRAGQLVTLVLSDVLGDPLDLIASGPTVPDSSSAKDAIEVLAKFDPKRDLPKSVYQALEKKRNEKPRDISTVTTTYVIGNNAVAVDEAGIRAERLGYNHVMHTSRTSEGAAEDVGRHLASMVVAMLRADASTHRMDCLITGGEPVVTLADVSVRGKGGRNQQLVLAAYQHLLAQSLNEHEWDRFCILSGGTDGEDGPTDAAGAVLDGNVHRRAAELKLDVADSLRRNDAYTFFDSTGGLLMTGPTGTNVCDVRVALVRSSSNSDAN